MPLPHTGKKRTSSTSQQAISYPKISKYLKKVPNQANSRTGTGDLEPVVQLEQEAQPENEQEPIADVGLQAVEDPQIQAEQHILVEQLESNSASISDAQEEHLTIGDDDGVASVDMYRGYKLSIDSIVRKAGEGILKSYMEKCKIGMGVRNRMFVKCLVCAEFEEAARQLSHNNQVYAAKGIRCDGKKKLQDVVDHLFSRPHLSALKEKELLSLWKEKSTNHPWVKLTESTDTVTMSTLIHMAVDAYNDSKILTPSAWSWPSRSLAQMHSSSLFQSQYCSPLPFMPSGISLHYRDPMTYAEMLHIIGDIERKKLAAELKDCIRFSIQVDGSLDMKQQDKKFVMIRFNTEAAPLNIITKFVGVVQNDERGANGLLKAVKDALKGVNITDFKKIVGLSTDGESANTGKKNGLWAKMESFVGRPIINYWCVCHHSDLAMEDLFSTVPELKLWHANVLELSKFYRASGVRTKELRCINSNIKSFPSHHEVRFAQHLVQLCEAIMKNLQACMEHWIEICNDTEKKYTSKERNAAKCFLRVWNSNSPQTYLTAVMIDTLSIFRYIEKQSQQAQMTIADVLKYRDIACEKLELQSRAPYPGNFM